jgi:hypothetical protein
LSGRPGGVGQTTTGQKTGVRDVSDPVPFGKRHGDAVRTIASAVSRLSSGTVASSTAQAWNRVHPRLTHRSAWLDHQGELPLVEGTLIRPKVEHLSKDREAPPVWLWSSRTGADLSDVDRCWQVFLRRFDLEHTFRFAKQTLGWTTPKLRTPEAADRWIWILVAALAQLRLARPATCQLKCGGTAGHCRRPFG